MILPLSNHVVGVGSDLRLAVFVLSHISYVRDDAEVDARGGKALRSAVHGEGVEEGACGCISGLAACTGNAGDGGEKDEEREGLCGEKVVQIPGAADLGVDDCGVVGVGGKFEYGVLGDIRVGVGEEE